MTRSAIQLPRLLDELESLYGFQQPSWPTDPYLFLVWWHCGYPASDIACAKGWASLTKSIGTTPEKLLAASPEKLATALKPGGMVPELRAQRLKEIAMRIKDHLDGDLRTALTGPLDKARKELKKFPNIADPGVDRILLFAHIAPIAAVPSNSPHVLVRILLGRERENYVRQLPRSPNRNRIPNTRSLRRPHPRLSPPEAARPANLQTHQSKMRSLPRQYKLRLLLRQASRPSRPSLKLDHPFEEVASSA